MLNKLEERVWTVLNEKEGKWTYIEEKGTSVIDYVIVIEKALEKVQT